MVSGTGTICANEYLHLTSNLKNIFIKNLDFCKNALVGAQFGLLWVTSQDVPTFLPTNIRV